MAGLNGHNNDSKEVVPNCNHFNASRPEFRVQCQPHEKGCLKGWISQVLPIPYHRAYLGFPNANGFFFQAPYPKINNGIVRSCTPIQDNVCLYQQGGGACSCGHDLCNGGMGHPKMTLLPLILLPQLSSYLLKTMLILVESEKQHYFRSRTTTWE